MDISIPLRLFRPVSWLAALSLLMPATAFAFEAPKYTVVEEMDRVEIRQYERMVVARTIVPGSFNEAGNAAFPRLGGYISGENEAGSKISMTVPVMQSPEPDSGGQWALSFYMPSKHGTALPAPNDPNVKVTELEPQTFAVIRYKGNWKQSRFEKNLGELQKVLGSQSKYRVTGSPVWARFDPPFMPGFLKTNEIMIPVLMNNE